MIQFELISYLEKLSCLELSSDEKNRLTGDLEKILGCMNQLGKLNTEGVPERSHPFDNINAFRDDIARDSLARELLLRNAPECDDEMFIAPKTVE